MALKSVSMYWDNAEYSFEVGQTPHKISGGGTVRSINAHEGIVVVSIDNNPEVDSIVFRNWNACLRKFV